MIVTQSASGRAANPHPRGLMLIPIRSLAMLAAFAVIALTVALPAGPAWGQNNSCQYAFDGDCDEPGIGTGLCAAGTDTQDCSIRDPGPNSCQYANDGECDHPGVGTGACPPNTDQNDCGGRIVRARQQHLPVRPGR